MERFRSSILDHSGITAVSAAVTAGLLAVFMALVLSTMGNLLNSTQGVIAKSSSHDVFTELLNMVRDEKTCTKNFIGKQPVLQDVNQMVRTSYIVGDPNTPTPITLGLRRDGFVISSMEVSEALFVVGSAVNPDDKLYSMVLRVTISPDTTATTQASALATTTREIPFTAIVRSAGGVDTIKKCSANGFLSDSCKMLGGDSYIEQAADGNGIVDGLEDCIFPKTTITSDRSLVGGSPGAFRTEGNFVVLNKTGASTSTVLFSGSGTNLSTVNPAQVRHGTGTPNGVCWYNPVDHTSIDCPALTWEFEQPAGGMASALSPGNQSCAADQIVCGSRFVVRASMGGPGVPAIAQFDLGPTHLGSSTFPGPTSVQKSLTCCKGRYP